MILLTPVSSMLNNLPWKGSAENINFNRPIAGATFWFVTVGRAQVLLITRTLVLFFTLKSFIFICCQSIVYFIIICSARCCSFYNGSKMGATLLLINLCLLLHLFNCLCLFHICSINNMMIVAGDYSLTIYEGTEQEIMPQLLIPHPDYNSATNNNDIMLIKVQPVFTSVFLEGVTPSVNQLVALSRWFTDHAVLYLSSWGPRSTWTATSPSPCCPGRETPYQRAECVECQAGDTPASSEGRSPPPSVPLRSPSSPQKNATAVIRLTAASQRTCCAPVTAWVEKTLAK